jgi:hypothetical protein
VGDRAKWKAKNNPLVNGPGPKSMPKRLSSESPDKRWFIVPLASWTVPLFAHILDYRLSAPGLAKSEINHDLFGKFVGSLKPFALVLGADSLR